MDLLLIDIFKMRKSRHGKGTAKGNRQTVLGAAVSHTYAAAGNYEAKAEAATKDGSSRECSHAKNKSITVN